MAKNTSKTAKTTPVSAVKMLTHVGLSSIIISKATENHNIKLSEAKIPQKLARR